MRQQEVLRGRTHCFEAAVALPGGLKEALENETSSSLPMMPSLSPDLLISIAEELARQDVSLVNFALGSHFTLAICRPLLFGTLVFNLERGTDQLCEFRRLVEINPSLVAYTRALTIIEDAKSTGYQLSSCRRQPKSTRGKKWQTNSTEVEPDWNDLGKVLSKFTALQCLHISVRRHDFRSEALSPGLDLILQSPHIRHVSLCGLRDISQETLRCLLQVQDVHLAECTFFREDTGRTPSPVPAGDLGEDAVLKTFRYEPISKVYLFPSESPAVYGMNLASVRDLTVGISSPPCLEEAGATIQALRHRLTSLSIDTLVFPFPNLRVRLCAPFLREARLQIIGFSDHSREECKLGMNELAAVDKHIGYLGGEVVNPDGRFCCLMAELPLHQPFQELRVLSFNISFWPHCFETRSNGEAHWLGYVFRGMNNDTANRLEAIEIILNVATGNCVENVEVISEMKSYEGWRIWDDALSGKKWTSLRRLKITIRTPLICNPEAETECQREANGLKDVFPRLQDKGVLLVTIEVDHDYGSSI